jgi:hypothetical protein
LAWVIENNPGVETNLLHSHLAFLMADNGGEYHWANGNMTKLPTNREIIAWLDASGKFVSKNIERGAGRQRCPGRVHKPRHWWRKDRNGNPVEVKFAA